MVSDNAISEDIVTYAGCGMKLDERRDVTEIIDQLKKHCKIMELDLSGNTLGISAAEPLGETLEVHSSLKRCIFSDLFTGRLKTEIAPALRHLSAGIMLSSARLVELDLSDNAFGPNGVVGVVDLLSSQTCSTLKILRMNNQGLGHEGCRYLAEALDKGRQLNDGRGLHLNIFSAGRNRLENVGAKLLADVFSAMGTLQELSLYQNGIGLHGLDGIHSLVDIIKSNPGLRLINFSDNSITPRGAKIISKALQCLDNLEELYLNDCLLKSNGCRSLGSVFEDPEFAPNLRVLQLAGNEITTNAGVSLILSLSNKSQLELMDLNANEFGKNGIAKLIRTLESVGLIHTLAKPEAAAADGDVEEAVGDGLYPHAFDEDQGSASEEEEEVEEDETGSKSGSVGDDYEYVCYEDTEESEVINRSSQSTENQAVNTPGKLFSFRDVASTLDQNVCSPSTEVDEPKPITTQLGLFSALNKTPDNTDGAMVRAKLWPTTPQVNLFGAFANQGSKTGNLFSPPLLTVPKFSDQITKKSSISEAVNKVDLDAQIRKCLQNSDQWSNSDIDRLTDLLKFSSKDLNTIYPHEEIRNSVSDSSSSPEHVIRLSLHLCYPSDNLPNKAAHHHIALGLLSSVLLSRSSPTDQTSDDGRAINCLLVHLGAIKAEKGSFDHHQLSRVCESEREGQRRAYLDLTRRFCQLYGKRIPTKTRDCLLLLLSEQKTIQRTDSPVKSAEVDRLRDDIVSMLQNQLSELRI